MFVVIFFFLLFHSYVLSEYTKFPRRSLLEHILFHFKYPPWISLEGIENVKMKSLCQNNGQLLSKPSVYYSTYPLTKYSYLYYPIIRSMGLRHFFLRMNTCR